MSKASNPTKGTTQDEREVLAAGGSAADRRQGRWGSPGMPAEKSHDFGAALRRLWGLLTGERPRLIVVLALTVTSVVLVVIGPRLLGEATDSIVSGVGDPGGIDFASLHRRLAFVAGLYVAS